MKHPDSNDHVRGYAGYEVGVRPVVTSVVGLAVGTVLVLWLMKLEHARLVRDARSVETSEHPLLERDSVPPDPRLQDAPARDLARVRALEDETLSSYGWVDREAGVTRIPIERAMEIVAKEGLPVRDAEGR